MSAIPTDPIEPSTSQATGSFDDEVRRGERFTFGKNWAAFLGSLTEERIARAESSLREMLKLDRLDGATFLDVGSGSGLSSLAARRMGARVISFDYDPQSVACARELKHRYFPDDTEWRIDQGSVLDQEYLNSLGPADIVYSWGVLHHTGRMWAAMENVARGVKPGGLLFVALYNDEGWKSRVWRRVKQVYCGSRMGRWVVTATFVPLFALVTAAKSIVTGTNRFQKPDARGMSVYYDWIDWLGGYPFEVATPEQVRMFYEQRGFALENERTTRRMGCNQFVFRRDGAD
jgi:2-polyprenyl-3-methyl-5-hydroxy-6-metoxy-1,4-benzoquinol methylase